MDAVIHTFKETPNTFAPSRRVLSLRLLLCLPVPELCPIDIICMILRTQLTYQICILGKSVIIKHMLYSCQGCSSIRKTVFGMATPMDILNVTTGFNINETNNFLESITLTVQFFHPSKI